MIDRIYQNIYIIICILMYIYFHKFNFIIYNYLLIIHYTLRNKKSNFVN